MRRSSIRVAMSEHRPEHKRRAPRGIVGALLVGAGLAALCPAAVVLAQEATGLRGEVAEADVNSDLLSGVPLLRKPTTLEQRGLDPTAQRPGHSDAGLRPCERRRHPRR